jgi:hypothetical protein
MDRATVRRGYVTSATSRATVHNVAFPASQPPGFIGETEGSSVQCSEEFATESYQSQFWSMFSVGSDNYKWSEVEEKVCRDEKIWSVTERLSSYVIIGVWDCYSFVSISVAGKRLVETGNPSAYATVSCNWYKQETALYSLYKCNYEWVCNHLIINPIIRTRARLISAVRATILSQTLDMSVKTNLQ